MIVDASFVDVLSKAIRARDRREKLSDHLNHVVSTIRAIIIISETRRNRPRDYPPEETRDPDDSGRSR